MKFLTFRHLLLMSVLCLTSSPALADLLNDSVWRENLGPFEPFISETPEIGARIPFEGSPLHMEKRENPPVLAKPPVVRSMYINKGASKNKTRSELQFAFGRIFTAQRSESETVDLKTDVDQNAWISDLKGFIPKLMAHSNVPGLSIAVIKDAEIAWTGSFGVKSNRTQEAVNGTTVFQAASLSKPVFAYAVMKLVDQGKLELDRPLLDYLPFRYLTTDDRVDVITARMALSHTTGFPNWRHGALKLHFTPGEKFSYSGEGYIYLQHTIEKITGQPLDQFMQEQVFAPLRMQNSSYVWRDDFKPNHAVGHSGSAKVKSRGLMRYPKSASSLYTTAGDYARFLVAVLEEIGLQKASSSEMLTPQVRLADCLNCTRSELRLSELSNVNAWGLGWGLQTTDEGTSFWHWGDNDVYKSYAVAFVDQKIGLVYFANSENGLAIRDELVTRAIGGLHPAFSWLRYEQN